MLRLSFRLVVIAAVAGSAMLLLVLGREYGPQFLFGRTVLPEPAGETVSAGPSISANPLDLSVFNQPRVLPEIRFADDQEHDLTLADFQGRVILLNMWATWCVPCRKEMPALDRLEARLGGEEFLVIPLSIDREGVGAVKRFYQQLGLEKLGIYVDRSGRGSRGLGLPGVPTTLLIDRQGREVARKLGAAEWDDAEMVGLVRRTIDARSSGAMYGNR